MALFCSFSCVQGQPQMPAGWSRSAQCSLLTQLQRVRQQKISSMFKLRVRKANSSQFSEFTAVCTPWETWARKTPLEMLQSLPAAGSPRGSAIYLPSEWGKEIWERNLSVPGNGEGAWGDTLGSLCGRVPGHSNSLWSEDRTDLSVQRPRGWMDSHTHSPTSQQISKAHPGGYQKLFHISQMTSHG